MSLGTELRSIESRGRSVMPYSLYLDVRNGGLRGKWSGVSQFH